MKSNVFIMHRQRGKLVERREMHNVWTDYGHQYLAHIVSELGPFSSPTPERTDRLKYVGLGVGGVHQDPLSLTSPIVDAYPTGYAELRWPPDYTLAGYSNGDEYNQQDPSSPLIQTLERPVRRTGGQIAYPGAATDRWFMEPPNVLFTHLTLQEVTVHAFLYATSGDYIYGTFTQMPVTEAGLFTDAESPTGTPYSSTVAYVNFDTILLDSSSEIEFVWRAKFG